MSMGADVKPPFLHFPQPRAPAREGLIIGVDLGAGGAVSLIDADGLAAIICEWQPSRAVVEFVASRPTDSPTSAFAFDIARATVISTLEVLGAGRGQNSTARAEATRRWPQFRKAFARAKDDGRGESALIGLSAIMRARSAL